MMAVEMPKMADKPPLVPARRSITRTSFFMKRPNERLISADLPSDIVIDAAGTKFGLHKFALAARSGRFRRLLDSNVGEPDDMPLQMELPDIPGGSEAFDLAAKFCYGVDFDITVRNVAFLRCAAEYLEMTEDYSERNLVFLTETFLNEVVFQSLADSLAVLHNCEDLLPAAEDLQIVRRCIDAAAAKACRDQFARGLPRLEYDASNIADTIKLTLINVPKVPVIEWWAEDLAILHFNFFQRTISAMRSKGLMCESIGGAIMHFAHRALKKIHNKQNGLNLLSIKCNPETNTSTGMRSMEHEQRALVETIVSILPSERNTVSCSFLFDLLRTSLLLETTVACRLELERRAGMQLEQATLDELMIPSFSTTGDTLFDSDIVKRILMCYMRQHDSQDVQDAQIPLYEKETGDKTRLQNSLRKVANLVDTYLAEIAPDTNLKIDKFIALSEVLPDRARAQHDGLYRAIDIFLKAHPTASDSERRSLCKLMDCQKLSQDACTHVAQNERLPVQVVVQVLYIEQLRLRTMMTLNMGTRDSHKHSNFGHMKKPSSVGNLQRVADSSPNDNYATVRKENRELRLEIACLRMRLTELEKDHNNFKQDLDKESVGSKFLTSVSKTFVKLNPFVRRDSRELLPSISVQAISRRMSGNPESRSGKPRRRRHSMS